MRPEWFAWAGGCDGYVCPWEGKIGDAWGDAVGALAEVDSAAILSFVALAAWQSLQRVRVLEVGKDGGRYLRRSAKLLDRRYPNDARFGSVGHSCASFITTQIHPILPPDVSKHVFVFTLRALGMARCLAASA